MEDQEEKTQIGDVNVRVHQRRRDLPLRPPNQPLCTHLFDHADRDDSLAVEADLLPFSKLFDNAYEISHRLT